MPDSAQRHKLPTGKRPPVYDPRLFPATRYFTELAQAEPPPPKSHYGHLRIIRDEHWKVLGNDEYGDCVFAGADHEMMLVNREAGRKVEFDAKAALADYSAVTGFDPKDPDSDQGTIVTEALRYRRRRGSVDVRRRRHKIGAYVALEPGNVDEAKRAMATFGFIGIGFEFPESAFDQFYAGEPWRVVPGAKIEGGHYVPLVYYNRHYAGLVTWGKYIRMTWAFYRKYCDEAYAMISREAIDDTGHTIDGFDLAQLRKDLRKLR